MGMLDEDPADLEREYEAGQPHRFAIPISKEGCICGIVAVTLVITSVGLLLWRMNANPAANDDRPAVPEGPEQLNDAAWLVVRNRQATPDAYARAFEQAEAAVRGAPENGNILNTLGVAQYRMGRYADALATLTKSEKLNATKAGSHPADLAFLAMAQHQLGQDDEAQATLARLRDVAVRPRWFRDVETRHFLHEAEETLKEKPASEKK